MNEIVNAEAVNMSKDLQPVPYCLHSIVSRLFFLGSD